MVQLRFLRAGTDALLVELAGLDEVLALAAALAAEPLPHVRETVPAARTLLLRFDPVLTDAATLAARLRRLPVRPGALPEGRTVEIPVRYDGADLAEAAALVGLDPDGLVRRHAAAGWVVAFAGFAPGFAYLSSDDPGLDLPRRKTPRERIPAGSVALAGRFSGVYPAQSPGGWQLIGTTDLAMWDLSRAQPALLAPGDRVRFVPVTVAAAATGPGRPQSARPWPRADLSDTQGFRAAAGPTAPVPASAQPQVPPPGTGLTATAPAGGPAQAGLPPERPAGAGRQADRAPNGNAAAAGAQEPAGSAIAAAVSRESGAGAGLEPEADGSRGRGQPAAQTSGPAGSCSPALVLLRLAGTALWQDTGRPGMAAQGIGGSGAMDRAALAQANRLLGNPAGLAALEFTGGLLLRAETAVTLALCGAIGRITLTGASGRRLPQEPGRALALDAGDRIEIGPAGAGVYGYLALRGGFGVRRVLGSAARDTLSGIGTAPLLAGDPLWPAGTAAVAVDPAPLAGAPLPRPGDTVRLDVIAGPRADMFPPGALQLLAAQDWRVSRSMDRIGVRLLGDAPLLRGDAAELLSEAAVRGAIQVPHSGQPVLFMADHPLTGGYPVIGCIAGHHLDLAAQIPPGARIRFTLLPEDPPCTSC